MYGVIAANSSLVTAQGNNPGNRDIPGSNCSFNKFQFQPELETGKGEEKDNKANNQASILKT
jgi:hypothetical protein